MDLLAFVDRLLKCRPVVFYGSQDSFKLRNGERGTDGFQSIGTPKETPPLILCDYLSYDEMKISALLSVSSNSFFVNSGARYNKGIPEQRDAFQNSGVIVGQVGPRFEKQHLMEWQDCVSNKRGVEHPLAPVWFFFYCSSNIEDTAATEKKYCKPIIYLPTNELNIFSGEVYQKRIKLTVEIFIAEANTKSEECGLKGYIHVTGLGLGVWGICSEQDQLFVDAWGETLKNMDTKNISAVNFSWIDVDNCLGVKDGGTFPNTNVKIYFSKRSLHDKVPKENILICNYSWDGNAFPGNEYWVHMLSASGDPAAACSSQIAEVHNPFINTKICAQNLRVVTQQKVFTIKGYIESC